MILQLFVVNESRDEESGMLISIILCGGSGERLWPQSRSSYPKQLIKLVDKNKSQLQITALRARELSSLPPVIICNQKYRFLVAEQMRNIGIDNAYIVLEAAAKGTAMAIASAVSFLSKTYSSTEITLAIMPADHFIKDQKRFCNTLIEAGKLAAQNQLITLGIKPSFASDAYGYIELGKKLSDGVHEVSNFIEKPDQGKAQKLLDKGSVCWNSGVYVVRKCHLIQLFRSHLPDTLVRSQKSVENAKHDMDFIWLDESNYQLETVKSFDSYISEKTKDIQMIEYDSEWSDLGSWEEIFNLSEKDENNNALDGDVCVHDVKSSLIKANSRLVAAIGVSNCIIVETKGAILVADKSRSQEVKAITEKLRAQSHPELLESSRVYRPWGYYETIDIVTDYKVKRIVINIGARISLQKHMHRCEHWVVVKGTAKVQCGENVFHLHHNQSTYIPKKSIHRIENIDKCVLEIIEVQTGAYLGEDDIERFEDDYNRIKKEPSLVDNVVLEA